MGNTVIKVENICKEYRLGTISHGTLYRDLQSWSARLRGKQDPNSPLNVNGNSQLNTVDSRFLALDNVSFDVQQGDVVGIIGRNGAGKSTILKILSQVTCPTSGVAKLKGRVASLLEVGTGFHPELTGRENVFLNGAILGMTKSEILRKFDEIVAFAELEKFIDTPVKRYSSGMYVRLAFAVAAHLEPEILIIDEVLAVGDVQFQKKCLGKMQVVGKEGRTVLFVSHNMEAVRKLCTKGLLIDKGKITTTGKTEEVIRAYLASGFYNQSTFEIQPPEESDLAGYAYKITIEDGKGCPINEIPVGQPWQIRVNFIVKHKVEHFIVALGFLTELNAPFRTCYSTPRTLEPGEYQAIFREEILILATGIYPIIVGLSIYGRPIQYVENAGFFRVAEISNGAELTHIDGVGLVLNPMISEISPV